MTGPSFYIVDVFAEKKHAGNQLAVFTDARGLGDEEMQQLAREMNFSETTFVLSDVPRDGGYDVRIFTPTAEVPFAGHPTLGTAYVIRHALAPQLSDRVILNLGVGQIPVVFDGDVVWMTPREAVFGEVVAPGEIAPLLSVAESEFDEDFPIQSVSAGLPFILLPLRDLDVVRRAGVLKDKWLEWVKDREAKNLFVFCRDAVDPGNHIHARMFADYYGIAEDPATGSANCCFAAYLVKHRYFDTSQIDIRVEQGYEMGRPSLIYLRANERDGRINVNVGGKVVCVAKGNLV
jgi:trans-2,3-dihydro-3-hydroxyanthranilate isomerase